MACIDQEINCVYFNENEEIKFKLLEDHRRKVKKILRKENFNINIGPNVNIRMPKNANYSQEEKEWFEKKLKETKKTELCKNWVLYKDCFYKNNCSFAHGENELRGKKTEKIKKYKTKICNVFIDKMDCSFGNRCQYRHIITEKRLFKYSYLNYKMAYDVITEINKEEEMNDFTKILEIISFRSNIKM